LKHLNALGISDMRILIYDTINPNARVTNVKYLLMKGVEVILLNEKQLFSYGKINYFSPKVRYSIEKVLHRTRPSVIHVHGIRMPVALLLFSVARRLKIPIVATLHSYKLVCPITHYVMLPELVPCKNPYPNSKCSECVKWKAFRAREFFFLQNPTYKIYINSLRRIYRQADILVALSLELYRLYKTIGYHNVTYLPNPVEIPNRNYLLNKAYGKSQLNVGFLGRFEDYKGVRLLPLIARRCPEVNIHIAGWGSLKNWLIRISNKYENMIFHGYLTGSKFSDLMKSLDIVVVPSICCEACPGVVLDAFAYGKPVVCFNLGGQAELVKLARAGLLAKPFSVDDLCGKIRILMNDPNSLAEFGLNGRKWVEQKCSPEKHADILIGIYNKII